MPAVALNPRQHSAHLVRGLPVGIVENELGIAENGIERRAQLMTHIRQEQRLVLTGLREIATFLLDLIEQPNGLDRNYRLVRKGGDQLDLPLSKRPRNLANQYYNANR